MSEGSWVLKVHGAPVAVGAKEGPAELKMKTGLRLTDASATIVNLRKEPEFTPANDPYTKFTKATNKAASDYAQAQFASNYSAAQMYLSLIHIFVVSYAACCARSALNAAKNAARSGSFGPESAKPESRT